MDWTHLLASITGTVDQERLLHHESLATENRSLRHQRQGRLRLSDSERQALTVIGQKLGKPALQGVAQIVKPETMLAWHRTRVAQKFDGAQQRQSPGRPTIDRELDALIVRRAQDNRSWGYDRIVGALATLGLTVSAQTVGNVLRRPGIAPAPERQTTTPWQECIRTHLAVLVAPHCCTAKVWTLGGLVTYYVLFVLHLGSRKSQVAGITPHPNEAWMVQVARNVPMEAWGCLAPGPYRIPDRDTPCCAAFQHLSEDAGVECVVLPPRSPNFNASAERWVRAVKEACRARVRLCGEDALRHVLNEDVDHAHQKRHHQGKGNVLLLPRASPAGEHDGTMQCRERLGGLLQYYEREAE